ncbi:claudin-19 [Bombina bombina]|uniref:claudin-19 n=1 Tax=Bombina bombina TaxID=8345 RepID=UPI00235AD7F5|nr:claudin-19 [Bombina bombina]
MSSTPLQFCAFALALAGMISTLVTISSTRWKTSSSSGSLITSTVLFEGLWMNCVGTSTGSVQCKRFTSVFSLDTYIQVCRALMIFSLVLGFFACILSLLGLKCTKFGSNDENSKAKIALSGGILFIIAGLCCLIPVSWYAAMITAQFFDPLYGGTKYELGPALYIGWAGSLLAVLGGSLLCCSCKKVKKTSIKGAYKYNNSGPESEFTQFRERKEMPLSAKAYV